MKCRANGWQGCFTDFPYPEGFDFFKTRAMGEYD